MPIIISCKKFSILDRTEKNEVDFRNYLLVQKYMNQTAKYIYKYFVPSDIKIEK